MLLKEGEIHVDNLNYETGIRHSDSRTPIGYADSKLMNGLFALELSKRLSDYPEIRVFLCESRIL